MGYGYGIRTRLPDCPVCGKKEGAYMGSSMWHPFDGSACSDVCGEAARDALTTLMSSEVYRKVQDRLHNLQQELTLMRWKAVRNAGPASGPQA